MINIVLYKFILLEDVQGKTKTGCKFVVNRIWLDQDGNMEYSNIIIKFRTCAN